MNNNVNFDTPAGCRGELAEINGEIAEFASTWAENAGLLKKKHKKVERLHRAALLGIKGTKEKLTIPEKEALAYAAIEEKAPDLLDEIEELEEKVEDFKTRFKGLERRSSNAQSILGSHRDEAKLSGWIPDPKQPQWSGQRG